MMNGFHSGEPWRPQCLSVKSIQIRESMSERILPSRFHLRIKAADEFNVKEMPEFALLVNNDNNDYRWASNHQRIHLCEQDRCR